MSAGRLFAGVCAGAIAGYAAIRSIDALRAWNGAAALRPAGAAAYARARRASDVAGTVRGLLGAMAVAYGPLADQLDARVARLPAWLRPAAYSAIVTLAGAVIELPVGIVEDYNLERRNGLSEQPRTAWLQDYGKTTVISTAVTAIVATLFGAAVRRSPDGWPWIAAAGSLPLFVAGNVIVPLYLMPLFNTFEPIDGPLAQRLRALAEALGVGDAEILRMNMSRQTRKANAFVTGIGRTHRIVLGDTLTQTFPENEIAFVVAHEIGHYASRDTWRLVAVAQAMAVTLFALARALTPARQRRDLRQSPLLVARLYATMAIATQFLRPAGLAFSRSREWAADRYAVAASGDPATGAAALRRLRECNLADEDPPAWYELLFGSHPSLKRRIAALDRAAASL